MVIGPYLITIWYGKMWRRNESTQGVSKEKSYIRSLGKDLAKRYGRSKKYTSKQIAKTAKDENYNVLHICYAHAMYTSFDHFQQWHDEIGEICDFQAMRQEITDSFFNGNSASFKAVSESTSDSYSGFDASGIDSE